MTLTQGQLEGLERRGFVNLGPIFDAPELDQIRMEYDRLVHSGAQVLGNEADGTYPYRAMLNFRSASLKRCITAPALLTIATRVLGGDVRFWWDQGINTGPGSGSTIDWHQDNGYQAGRTQEYLTCWLALDESTLANGGLEVIPGSQRAGLLEHEWRDVHAVIPETDFPVHEKIPLDAAAGDLLIFSSLLVHRTVGNHTKDRHRRAWVIQYCRGDQHNESTGEVYDNRPWVVRGGEFVADPWSERPFDLKRDHASS
jgi:phytanoyl-CoA hydroxylase